jgi:N4-gp56 family major capsid protein
MDTGYGVNAPEAVKLWSFKLAREALKKTYAKRFMGKDSNSMIYIKNETNKSPGDRIRCTLRMQLTGDGVLGDGDLEGNEESLTTFTDDLIINQLRHAVRSDGKMTEQRIPFAIREEAMQGLSDWWATRWDTWMFNQLCGYTPITDMRYAGMNTIVAPSRQVFPAAITNDQSLTSPTDHVFSLYLIDKAIERAKAPGEDGVTPPIRPIKVDGQDYFVAFLHTYQVTDLRTTTSATTAKPILWYDIHKEALGSGKKDNPIFTGALGEYNGVILHESTRVTNGVHSVNGTAEANIRRAVLCGAQSAICGFGQGHDKSTYDWFEQLFDYGNKLGVKAGCIGGLKKSRYNSKDFGVVVMSSRAVQH